MWRSSVLVFLVIQIGPIQSAEVEQFENVRVARQVGVTECCPCDHSTSRSWNDQDKAADSSPDGRMGVVDDCPCRGRSADADGASSILFPNTVRGFRPFEKSDQGKKDLKPLLRPEVDLASSVLSTLKEVTDEDYQEALARDAARNAAKMLERDAQLEESDKNVVTIVLDPNSGSDFVAQESHNQESRCIHPLNEARSSYKPGKKVRTLLDNLWSPSSKYSLHDMDNNVEASNVNEEIAKAQSNVPSFKSNSINVSSPKNQLKMSTKDDCLGSTIHGSKTNGDIISNLDNSVSSSNTEQRLAGNPDFGEILSRPIKNLLKLGDVELIPKNVFGENKLSKDLIPPIDFDGLKQKLNQLKLPNLIEKIKRREPVQKIKPNVEDNGLAASDIEERVVNLPILEPFTKIHSNTFFSNARPKTAKENKLLTGSDHITNFAKLNHSLNERLSRIPNLLEGLRNQKDTLNKIDQQETGLRKADIATKLNELRQRTKNMLSERMLPSNLIAKTQRKKSDPINSSPMAKYKNAENCNDDSVRDMPEIHSTREDSAQTNLLDAATSPSKESPILFNSKINPQLEAHNKENINAEDEDFNEANGMATTPLGDTINFDINQKEQRNDNISESIAIKNENENIDISTEDITELPSTKSSELENEKNMKEIDDYTLNNNSNKNKESLDSISSDEILDDLDKLSSEVLSKSEMDPENESNRNVIKVLNKPVIRFVTQKKTGQKTENNTSTTVDSVQNENQNSADTLSDGSDLNKDSEEMFHKDNEYNTNSREDLSSSSTIQKPVTIKDLQKMSDSLLDQDRQQMMSDSFIKQANREDSEPDNTCNEPNFLAERATQEKLPKRQYNDDISIIKLEHKDSMDISASDLIREVPIASDKNEENEKNTCISDLALEKLTPDVKDDVSSEASEIIPNTLRFGKIVEPTSLRHLNNLLSSPQTDLLNLKLPTLREIHTKVTNVLDPLSKLSLADKSNTFEHGNDLIPDPSERKLKSVLPSRFSPEPLEIDVFQVNPLSSSRTPLFQNLPSINLDTIRTKLAMPKSLGIKPLRLESAVGDEQGMVGASLLFGSDKRDLMKAESTSLLDRIRNSNSLRGPTADLEDIGSRMREHFSSILNTDSSPIESLETLKSKAEDRVKNLHNTLKSSMRKAKETSSNILSNAYAQPNDLIEEISQRHEDLTDKLKGIHYDLNDRLTSLHDSFLEKTKLPKLDFFHPKNEVEEFQIKPRYNLQKTKPNPSGRKKVKKRVRNNDISYSTQKSNFERPQKFRMAPSASVQVPRTMETPKLMKSQNVLITQPLLREAKPEIKQQTKPMFNTSPPTQFKSNSLHPESELKTRTKHFRPPLVSKPIPMKSFRTTLPSTSITKDPKTLSDAKTVPSENVALKVPTPTSNSALQRLRSKSLISGRTPTPTAMKSTSKPVKQLKSTEDLRKAFTLPNLSWPKVIDKSFLSKVREAMRTRLDNAKAADSFKSIGKSNAGDMDRSASTNYKNIDALSKPIKENTSYKCKMICSRDSSEFN